MHQRNFILAALLLVLSASAAFAAETGALGSVALTKPAATSPQIPFSTVVTPDGQLISKPGTVFTQGGHYEGMQLPYLISTPKPIRYPHWAVRQGWQGEFVIAIEVTKNGSVGRTKIMKSTGHKRLDNAAISAVKSWTFHPAMRNGKIVVTCVELPVTFELRG